MTTVEIELTVNGQQRRGAAEPRRTLADFLREDLGLTGTHVGCEHGACGACTVLIDGAPARSCLVLAVQARGAEVRTVEGLAAVGEMSPLQSAMRDTHAFQCGYCAPGFLLQITALLAESPTPDEGEIREALSGNLCRCTGYESIIDGVLRAATARAGQDTGVFALLARYTGISVRRSEDARLLTGSGCYVDDVRLPGQAHAAFLRSPLAHARVAGIDPAAARRAPGVIAVYTGADIERLLEGGDASGPGRRGRGAPGFTVLATGKVRFAGDPVVLVVAESRYAAEDACELIDVDYDPLPAVVTTQDALDPASVLLFDDAGTNVQSGPLLNAFGDVAGAFARADRVVRARLSQHRYQNAPIECRRTISSFDPATGELTTFQATQGVHTTRRMLAGELGMDPGKVRVVAGDVGGSFGLKAGAAREDVACAAAARDLGRPVKWTEDRCENLTAAGQAREERFDVEAAVTADGEILGLKVAMVVDLGAYPRFRSGVLRSARMGPMLHRNVMELIPGPYRIGALSFAFTSVITNKASYVSYRGPWASETWVRERLVDLVARELGRDPFEVRMRNVVVRGRPPSHMVTGRSLAGVTAKESLERVAAAVDLPALRRRQQAARWEGRYLGVGIATYIQPAPGARRHEGGRQADQERVCVRIERDGALSVATPQMPAGQSHETTLAQVAADEFGVPFDQVRVVVGDTGLVPHGFGTGGSRSAAMAGGACLHASRELRRKVLRLASRLLGTEEDAVSLTAGMISVNGVPVPALSLAQVAAAAEVPGPDSGASVTRLEVTTVYDGGEGGWSGETHCAVVEVDIETGLVRIDRYVVAVDCGVVINPAIVEGQIRGGVAQGIGAVLLERSAYDEQGQFRSGTFADYLLPTTLDVPRVEIEYLDTVSLDADVNFRGVGEGAMVVAPPTVCNAVEDALAPLGVRVHEQHLPPWRILELIDEAAAGTPDPRRARCEVPAPGDEHR